jgi:hypothetical protein
VSNRIDPEFIVARPPIEPGNQMTTVYYYRQECPWIVPCPVCGSACCVTVTSGAPLSISVDYACQRKHVTKG